MTSFGATNTVNNAGYMPTFKVQGQIYHGIGSLLPVQDEDPKFLQIYFTGNEAAEADQRCAISTEVRLEIVLELQTMFHEHNSLIHSFKTALNQMPTDDYKVVIRADKTSAGEHKRRFNAPVKDDVAVVMVGTEFERRNIIIHLRNENLRRVAETHRSYDALQYPVLSPRGENDYHFNVMQRVYFTEKNAEAKVAQPPYTTLTAFFELCSMDDFAKTLLYPEVPKYYTWNTSQKKFMRRKNGAIVSEYPVLTTCAPSNPRELWKTHRESLCEDILRQSRITDPNQEYSDDIFNQALLLIEDICLSINNKALSQLGMPALIRTKDNIYDSYLTR
ncbi:hypothetical protein EVAR_64898_1 [Eumeta japonica]|uniref:Helitron helicase-like domain-containing protein n=1 Tax=Eumeta variegata TaxID=151549 RepID=A0A4C1ZXR6_EUMVA|nr:hypothetical protein EVAR_64898_1 [Eumeta japonica]